MTVVYLAGPIDKAKPEQAMRWGLDLQDEVHRTRKPENPSVSFFFPATAWRVQPSMYGIEFEDAYTIRVVNEMALETSDIIVVRYMPSVPSWGVPQELAIAANNDIDILVYTEEYVTRRFLPVNVASYPLRLVTASATEVANYINNHHRGGINGDVVTLEAGC
jgi:hypothetical protein